MEEKERTEMTLEDGFKELDTITEQLEEPSLPLEERFELYKKGMDLIRACTEKIDMVEKKLIMINKDGEMD